MLAAAGCRMLLLAEKQRHRVGFALTSRSCVNSGEVNCPASMDAAPDGSDVIHVSAETVLSRREVDRRVLAADLGQAIGLKTCEGARFSHSAKPRYTPWIGAGCA